MTVYEFISSITYYRSVFLGFLGSFVLPFRIDVKLPEFFYTLLPFFSTVYFFITYLISKISFFRELTETDVYVYVLSSLLKTLDDLDFNYPDSSILLSDTFYTYASSTAILVLFWALLGDFCERVLLSDNLISFFKIFYSSFGDRGDEYSW